MRLTILTIFLFVVLYSASALSTDDKEVQKAVDLAKQTFEQALKEQGGWVSTRKLISDAELSATSGDKKKALELAKKAKEEADLSLQQALNEKKKWAEPSYLNN